MGETEEENEEYGNFLMDFMQHEDRIFTSRVNLFLVAESLLILSYVTLLNSNDSKIFIILLGIAGILITFFYLIALVISLIIQRNLQNLALTPEHNLCPYYLKMKNEASPAHKTKGILSYLLRPHVYLGLFIPITFLVGWIILFILI